MAKEKQFSENESTSTDFDVDNFHYEYKEAEEFGPLDIYSELEKVQKKIETITKNIKNGIN